MSKIHINFMLNGGGLGDNVARMPAVQYVLNNYPEVVAHVWVPDYFLEFAKRSLSSQAIIRSFSQREKYRQEFATRVSDSPVHTNLSYHMTDHAFNLLVNQQVEDKHKDYLKVNVDDVNISKFDLPEKYVVVCSGFTAPVREFLPEHINNVTKYLTSKGYTPVFLGKTEIEVGIPNMAIKGTFKEEIDFTVGVNLINKTTLLETTKILYGAKTVVGVDNGLLHIASTHPTLPVVVAYTNVKPEHRLPYRNGGIMGYNQYVVTPPPKVNCCQCQSTKIFEFNHNFTSCVYPERGCADSLKADLYITHLDKIL